MTETIKLKVSEIIDIYDVIAKFQREKSKLPTKFLYAISRNLPLFEKEVMTLQLAQAPSPEFEKYDSERLDLCREYCEKEEDGKPKLQTNANGGQEFTFSPEKRTEFDEKLKVLSETYKDVREAQMKKISELNNVLQEEKEIEVYKINLNNFPETLTVDEMHAFLPITYENTPNE